MKKNRTKGIKGEDIATKYLISRGYKILDRNYRTKVGEIDIIAMMSDVLIFIEVKARTNLDFGYPYEAVDWRKRDRILKTSLLYIQYRDLRDYQIRYDIMEIYLGDRTKVNHIENAF
ncbi:MAG: YraN family protein [Tissierellia bacterium]|nr:YraN family protein [Tissierellia bacterium]